MKYVIYMGILFMPDKNAAAHRAHAISKIVSEGGYKPIIIGMDSEREIEQSILETETQYQNCICYNMRYPKNAKEWIKTIYDISDVQTIIGYYGDTNIQAIIAMDYYSFALARLMMCCKKHSIKLVVDTVDWFIKSNDSFPRNLVKDFDTYFRMKYLNKKALYMISISRYLHDYYCKSVSNIIEIPGVVIPYLSLCESNSNVDQSILSLAFVGAPGNKCEKEKIDWLIKSVCKINEGGVKLKFYIAGIDKETLFQNRKDIASLTNFDSSIICFGRIPHHECLKLVASCDFAVIIRESNLLSNAGFPTKLGEAFACGTPVLVTPTSNIAEYIPSTHGIITKECSEKSVKEALEYILMLTKEQILDMRMHVRKWNPLSYIYFKNDLLELIEK